MDDKTLLINFESRKKLNFDCKTKSLSCWKKPICFGIFKVELIWIYLILSLSTRRDHTIFSFIYNNNIIHDAVIYLVFLFLFSITIITYNNEFILKEQISTQVSRIQSFEFSQTIQIVNKR